MTLLRESDSLEQDASSDVEPEGSAEETRTGTESSRGGLKRALAITAVVLVVVFFALALFSGPIQNIWYRNRQHHLAADMNEPRPGIAPGQAVAVLQVPRLGVNLVVVEGDSPERLRNGPGHRVGTARPGTKGNSVIMGHRSAWGGPFHALGRVRKGDLIAVQTRDRITVVYRVVSAQAVRESDTRLLRPTSDHRLTLVTGRGGRFSHDRLIVTAMSGTPSRRVTEVASPRANTSGPSVIFNFTLLLAAIAFALAAGAAVFLRHRSGALARAVVIVPLVAAGALLLLLDLDLLLPPLN